MSEPLKKYIKNFGGVFQGEEDFKPCYLAADVEQAIKELEIDSRFSDHWKLGFSMCKRRLLERIGGKG